MLTESHKKWETMLKLCEILLSWIEMSFYQSQRGGPRPPLQRIVWNRILFVIGRMGATISEAINRNPRNATMIMISSKSNI